jgi:4-carboxymuconolactone decarboxylase
MPITCTVWRGWYTVGGVDSDVVRRLAIQDRATTVEEDIRSSKASSAGSKPGYTPGPLVLDPGCGVNSEHSVHETATMDAGGGRWKRKATLGAEYVEKNLAAADDFTRPFQEAMTAWCWGFGWGDETIDPKTRSMMNLAMIGALGKMHEWETHCRGALTNGVSSEEIRAIIHVVGIYCGVPQALECFRVAQKVLAEHDSN